MDTVSDQTPSKKIRKIIHVDMDAFYCSVEQLDNPKLRGKPIVVGGRPDKRGVVAAASYEARKYGIRSAMPSKQAQLKCPQLIFVKGRFARYKEISQKIMAIFKSITTKVQPLSLDEAFLDVTENSLNEPLAGNVAIYIRKRIKEEVGLTASAGVAPNKFLAKIASDFNKPDGLTIIPPDKVIDFLTDLPVRKMFGVGPATAKKLNSMGIFKVGDIRKRGVGELRGGLGKFGPRLLDLSFGKDDREVGYNAGYKSIGAEVTTGKDMVEEEKILSVLARQCEEVSERMGRSGYKGKTVSVKIRYHDFTTITRSSTMGLVTNDYETIYDLARGLVFHETQVGEVPIRLIGVTMTNLLSPGDPEQLVLDFER
jgi:DNA polymerase-4